MTDPIAKRPRGRPVLFPVRVDRVGDPDAEGTRRIVLEVKDQDGFKSQWVARVSPCDTSIKPSSRATARP
jgi:hypothetical protein